MRPQGDAGSDPRRHSESEEAGGDPSAMDPAVLEQVIAETLATDDEPLPATEMAALLDVARRFAGQQIELEKAAIALVDGLLSVRLASHRPWIPPTRWQDMCRDVAASLCDAPVARARLTKLWEQLSAAHQASSTHD